MSESDESLILLEENIESTLLEENMSESDESLVGECINCSKQGHAGEPCCTYGKQGFIYDPLFINMIYLCLFRYDNSSICTNSNCYSGTNGYLFCPRLDY